MSATGRLLLALILTCALVSACAAVPVGGPPPSPAATPAARAVSPAGVPRQTATPVSQPSATTATGPGVSGSPSPDVSSAAPAEPTPVVDIPPDDRQPAIAVQTVGGSRGVPILMYHYIRVNPVPKDRIGYGLSIPPADFEAQMAYLAAHGYRSVTLADVASGAAFRGPGRPVAITFDDGYDDAYTEAFPILTHHGFRATFFIITELIGRPSYMTWDQVRALAAAGNAIGSHTESHPNLTRLDVVSLYAQLAVSRTTLEAQLGQPVLDFCYPAGRYNLAVEEMVSRVGYKTAVTVRPGIARPGDDLLTLPRVRVYGGVKLDAFANLVEGLVAGPTRVPAS